MSITPDCFSISGKVQGELRDGSAYLCLGGTRVAMLNADECRWLADTMNDYADMIEGNGPDQAIDLETSVAKLRRSLRKAIRQRDRALGRLERINQGAVDLCNALGEVKP